MKVFLSWSGDRSKAVAQALDALLPSILQPITCWMSEGGIAKGKPWFDQLAKQLNDILFGVFCVTPENKDSEWMLWEAGFLSSAAAVGDRHVAPLAIGMSKGSLSGPLSIYQGTDSTKDDVLRLVKEINAALSEDKRVPVQRLESTFGYVWPDLESRITAALKLPVSAAPVPKTSVDDQLAEVVALLRANQREAAETKAIVRNLESQTVAARDSIFADPAAYLRSNPSIVGGLLGSTSLARPQSVLSPSPGTLTFTNVEAPPGTLRIPATNLAMPSVVSPNTLDSKLPITNSASSPPNKGGKPGGG